MVSELLPEALIRPEAIKIGLCFTLVEALAELFPKVLRGLWDSLCREKIRARWPCFAGILVAPSELSRVVGSVPNGFRSSTRRSDTSREIVER